mmetsp:Transcript_23478/g.73505  ORF Transcript_23478/g.73505 Transcript_23478/m.73505 type:complete len:247 (+) Transcript_23478:37-777(+)
MFGTAAVLGTTAAAWLGSEQEAVDDKTEVEAYFNGDVGFGRWNRIYSMSEDVNSVQLDIRKGHDETIEAVVARAGEVAGSTWCDVGCGVGSLALPVAQRGAKVYASDISAAMVAETTARAAAAGVELAECVTADMESIKGSYETVSCIDVMIHYPDEKMRELVQKLTDLSSDRVFVSFAPKTLQYQVLKKIGSLFPGPSKATRAYLHAEADVVDALQQNGYQVLSRHLTARNFYFSLLLEAKRVAA